MDDMELESIVNVPDTPDRPISRHGIPGKCSGNMDEKNITDLAWRNFALAENDNSSRLVTTQKICCNNEVKSGSSLGGDTPMKKLCAQNNASLFRRAAADRNYDSNHSNIAGKEGKGKAVCTNSPMSCTRKVSVLDLTENKGQSQGVKTASQLQRSEKVPAVESTRKTPSARNNSSVCIFDSYASPSCPGVGMKKTGKNDHGGLNLAMNRGKMVDLCDESSQTIDLQDSLPYHPFNIQRFNRQKRLVRNGCISPNNVATKAKELTKQNDDHSSSSDALGRRAVSSDKHIADISNIVAAEERSNKMKGKGLLTHQSMANGGGTGNAHCRNSSELFGARDGWRTISADHSLQEVMGHPFGRKQSVGCSTSMQQRNRVDGKLSGSRRSSKALCNHLEDSASQSTSGIIFGPHGVSEPHNVENASNKRQRKDGTTSRNDVECGHSVSCDCDVILQVKSGELSNPRSSRALQPLSAEVVALSPERREAISLNSDIMYNEELDARARQLEADERLALELQQQFYHEEPALDDRERFFPSQSNAWPLPQNNQNPSRRRRARAQVLIHNRTVRGRRRSVGQSHPPRVSDTRRSFRFPLNMDLDMRLDILEALESAAGDGMTDNIFQIQRDFNENDYEMLLALDENNHCHAGASTNQISSLPQSQVQTDSIEESCAICLETPTFGETIRHLPCLHKFHKECIDPWLLRRTSCPVCKSSIT